MANNFTEKISLTLDVDGSQAKVGLTDFAKTLRDVEGDENDTRTAGQKMAAALSDVADTMQSEFKQARSAADKLATALGDDGVRAFKDAGRSVDDLVADLKRAGLSYQDVEADADSLAGSLKKLNGVGRDIDAHITKNMQGVETATNKASGVAANFMGNMAQELPGVAGAFGPLNMAISQFVEYGTEGDIAIGNLVGTLGIMAAGFAAFQGLSEVVGQVKDLGSWEREAAKRADEMRASAENAAGGLDIQTVATLSARDATVAYAEAMRQDTDQAVRDAIAGNSKFLDTMVRYGVTIDEVVAATHSHTAATELNNKITAKAIEMGDMAASHRAGHHANAITAEGEALVELNKYIWRNGDANDAATASLLKLARVGDTVAIGYLKSTGQWDLLTEAEQKSAQAALDRAAADDIATEAAKKRAAAQRDLNDSYKGEGGFGGHGGFTGGATNGTDGPGRATHNVALTVNVTGSDAHGVMADPNRFGQAAKDALDAYYRSGGPR